MRIQNTRDTLSETYLDALKIRHEVFVKGQGIAHTLEVGSPLDEAMSVHFVLYNDKNLPCGTCRLLTREKDEVSPREDMSNDGNKETNNKAEFAQTSPQQPLHQSKEEKDVRQDSPAELAMTETLLQRMAVLDSERHKGYASLLLKAAIDFAKTHDIKEITLHAQLSAKGFYDHFDFLPVGEIFEEAGIEHISMSRVLLS